MTDGRLPGGGTLRRRRFGPATAPTERRSTRIAHDRLDELTAPERMARGRGIVLASRGRNSTRAATRRPPVRLPARAPTRLGSFELRRVACGFVRSRDADVTSARDSRCRRSTFDPEKGQKSAIATDDLVMFIITRGDRFGVRLLDPRASARTNFKGLRYFPLRTTYRVQAKFVPYDTPKQVPVPNVLGMTRADGESRLRRRSRYTAGTLSPRAGVRDVQARGSVLHLQGPDEPERDVPGRTLPSHAASAERTGRSISTEPTTRPARSRRSPRARCRRRRISSRCESRRES